jgi:hypothetical protein
MLRFSLCETIRSRIYPPDLITAVQAAQHTSISIIRFLRSGDGTHDHNAYLTTDSSIFPSRNETY